MRFRRALLPVTGLLVALVAISPTPQASAWVSGAQVGLGSWLSPDASLSTSGDYATDTFGDPWDFSNEDDLIPIADVGAGFSDGANISNGILTVATRNQAELRLLMRWPGVLPWGHDGWKHPIDAARYTQADFRIRTDVTLDMAIRFWTVDNQVGVIPFTLNAGDWQNLHFDLTDRTNYPFAGSAAVWAGPIVRFELFRSVAHAVGNPAVNVQLDWFRLHRADASRLPPTALPVAQVLTPNETGGADYATTVRGNPWDFAGLDDVGDTHDVANLAIQPGGGLTGTTTANDPFIGLPLGGPLDTDKYHRFTADVCYDGGFSLADTPTGGGGMIGRVVWTTPEVAATETQDFVVFPGCHKVTLDMITTPPESINDENTVQPTGWKGIDVTSLRFDLNEDRGRRNFTLQNVKLADDAAFTKSYDITFADQNSAPGTKADVYVTNTFGAYNGTRIASGLTVNAGTNTFTWTGNDERGTALPNATYWVYVVMHNSAGNAVGFSTGPVRIERPLPPTPSYFVPLTPARLLDTRTGQGGNISPLGTGVFTELNVTGVGGVPVANVTAVVLNVTVTAPTSSGYLTAWPSGEPQPVVSNVNFVPGQTVPNLVTVKVGANGRVNLFNSSGDTHVIADVAGYYTNIPPPSGGRFSALTPSRLLDTRIGTGAGGSTQPIGQDQSINLGVTGVGGVPASGVTAVALNVTVDQPTGTGYLTVWPAGEARPTASTHNFTPGITVANLVLAKVGANGQVSIYNSAGNTHVIADVIGYFSSQGGLFVPVTPQRLVDTRIGTGGSTGAMGEAATHTMDIANSNPVPAGAKAVVVNVTSVNSSMPSYITVWPTASTQPLASTLNPRPGLAVPNQAYLRVGNGGGLDAFNANGSTDIIVDVFGYVM